MNNYYPLVSIIILNLNRKKDLVKCLNSIQTQIYKNYEIILIDNASNDGSVEEVLKLSQDIRIFKTKKNLGTSYTRNAGVSFSKGEVIWFLDNDVNLENTHTLGNLIEVFSKDSSIHALGGEAKLDHLGKSIGTKKLKLFPNGLTKGYFYEKKSNINIPVEILPSCNLMIRKNCFNQVGGFDDFYFFYLEDIDLTYRLFKNNFKLFVYHRCPVVHNFSDLSRFKNHFISKRNRIYFILKNLKLKNIIFLPFYDFLYLVNFDNIKRIYGKLFQNQKVYKSLITKNEKKKITLNNIINTFKITFITVLSILTSYAFIPLYLLKYSFQKRNKINFLDKVNKSDFVKVEKNNKLT